MGELCDGNACRIAGAFYYLCGALGSCIIST